MKSLSGLNYYEVLQIPVDASFIEIKRAYRDSLSIYSEDSLATYSMFSLEERDNILKEIEAAFLTLIDEKARADYDKMLINAGQVKASSVRADKKTPTHLFRPKSSMNETNLTDRVRQSAKQGDFRRLSNEILSKDMISGNDLKKLRKTAGIELSEIDAVTKISVIVLRSIEENQLENLPADIYLKNFLKSYAEILQIDSQRVVDGYLKNITHIQKGDH
jgi:curved DNA-binding protein CbpA